MFFALLISLLGSAIAIRIFDQMVSRDLFERREMTKIGTACFCAQIFLVVALPRAHMMLWLAIFAPLVICFLLLLALVKSRSRAFKSAMRESLALMSLKMKAGRSFRQSFAEVISESEPRLRAKLSEISSAVVFSQQKSGLTRDLFVSEVVDELSSIDRAPHAAARRLAVFRDKLRIEDDVRRRSGQVLARIRAQSMIMTGLYFALAIFIVWKFGWKGNSKFVIGSAILFAAGAAWIWWGGRNLKWKV